MALAPDLGGSPRPTPPVGPTVLPATATAPVDQPPRDSATAAPADSAAGPGSRTTGGGCGAAPVPRRRRIQPAPTVGLALAVALMAAAVAVPPLTGWDLYDGLQRLPWTWRPPLHAHWAPRLGPGSLPALLVASVGTALGWRVAARARWPRLLAGAWALGLAWMVALALVDGVGGLGGDLASHGSYLPTAHHLGDVGSALNSFIARIPLHSRDNWPIQVAGHPPGAVLFFVLLVRIGLGTPTAAGLVVAALAATTPVAVLVTLRLLGAEQAARRVAPLLVLSPAAIWCATSADALFAAVAAWGLAALAAGARGRHPGRPPAGLPSAAEPAGGWQRIDWSALSRPALSRPALGWSGLGWSALGGLLLGCCLMLSYGLVLIAAVAIAVLVAGRSPYPMLVAAPVAIGVVGVFALLGFSWWDAYPVLTDRYWAGLASRRPAGYWWWGDLAAFCFAAGPLVGAGVSESVARLGSEWSWDCAGRAAALWRRLPRSGASGRVPLLLAGGGLASVGLADASSMSKAEVERIWLPFLPWILVCCALLPAKWRRWGLVLQVAFALAVQHLLATTW